MHFQIQQKLLTLAFSRRLFKEKFLGDSLSELFPTLHDASIELTFSHCMMTLIEFQGDWHWKG